MGRIRAGLDGLRDLFLGVPDASGLVKDAAAFGVVATATNLPLAIATGGLLLFCNIARIRADFKAGRQVDQLEQWAERSAFAMGNLLKDLAVRDATTYAALGRIEANQKQLAKDLARLATQTPASGELNNLIPTEEDLQGFLERETNPTVRQWVAELYQKGFEESAEALGIRDRLEGIRAELQSLVATVGRIDETTLRTEGKIDEIALRLQAQQSDAHARGYVYLFPTHRRPVRQFTGHEDTLEELQRRFGQNRRTALTQAVHGFGGYGKTTVATEFVWRNHERYASVVWFDAGAGDVSSCDPADRLKAQRYKILDELAVRGTELDPRFQADREAAISIARQWLRQPSRLLRSDLPVLVVIDNAEDPDDALRLLAPSPGTHVLATTRAHGFQEFGGIEIELLSRHNATLLLLRTVGHLQPEQGLEDASEVEREAAYEAAEILGYLPLALEQAGSYLRHKGQGLKHFKTWWAQRREHLLGKFGRPTEGVHASVWHTVLEAYEALNPAAQEMVLACAFCDPEDVPLRIFAENPSTWPQELREACATPLDAIEVAADAAGFSIVRLVPPSEDDDVAAGGLSIHRMTAEVLRTAFEAQASGILLSWTKALSVSRLHDHKRWSYADRLLPHIRMLLSYIKDEREEAAELWLLLGNHQESRAAYFSSKESLTRAVQIARKNSVAAPSLLSNSLNSLGFTFRALGNLPKALQCYQEADGIDRTAFGDDHPRVATDITNIGSVLEAQGDLDGALQRYQEAERIDRGAFGGDHPEIATDINNIASVLKMKGDFDGALHRYLEAERIDRAAFGDDHPNIAIRVNNIGAVLKDQGNLPGALELYREAERIDRTVFGDKHPRVATRVNNIGAVLEDQGDLSSALDYYREAERIDRTALGDKHPNVAVRVNNIGSVLSKQGHLPSALRCFREALCIFLQAYGTASQSTHVVARNYQSIDGDPIALAREEMGDEAADELARLLSEDA